jgi:uncharacterized membrane protein YkoI
MDFKTIVFSVLALAGTGTLLWTGLTTADPGGEDHHSDHEQEEVRSLAQQGDILPLEQILQTAREHHNGRVLETELEREGDRYVYEIELLDEGGQVWELEFDAATGELLKKEQED